MVLPNPSSGDPVLPALRFTRGEPAKPTHQEIPGPIPINTIHGIAKTEATSHLEASRIVPDLREKFPRLVDAFENFKTYVANPVAEKIANDPLYRDAKFNDHALQSYTLFLTTFFKADLYFLEIETNKKLAATGAEPVASLSPQRHQENLQRLRELFSHAIEVLCEERMDSETATWIPASDAACQFLPRCEERDFHIGRKAEAEMIACLTLQWLATTANHEPFKQLTLDLLGDIQLLCVAANERFLEREAEFPSTARSICHPLGSCGLMRDQKEVHFSGDRLVASLGVIALSRPGMKELVSEIYSTFAAMRYPLPDQPRFIPWLTANFDWFKRLL